MTAAYCTITKGEQGPLVAVEYCSGYRKLYPFTEDGAEQAAKDLLTLNRLSLVTNYSSQWNWPDEMGGTIEQVADFEANYYRFLRQEIDAITNMTREQAKQAGYRRGLWRKINGLKQP